MKERKANLKRLKNINALKLSKKGAKGVQVEIKRLVAKARKSSSARKKSIVSQARRLSFELKKFNALKPLRKLKSNILKKN